MAIEPQENWISLLDETSRPQAGGVYRVRFEDETEGELLYVAFSREWLDLVSKLTITGVTHWQPGRLDTQAHHSISFPP